MKTNNLFKGIFIIALLAIVYFISVSQNCSKQSICKPDKNDGYDYTYKLNYGGQTNLIKIKRTHFI